MPELDELNIPKATRPVAGGIIEITDEVCARLLYAEYASLARRVFAKLARKRPSPLLSGRRAAWAAAVVYALGQVNFLFDSPAELWGRGSCGGPGGGGGLAQGPVSTAGPAGRERDQAGEPDLTRH